MIKKVYLLPSLYMGVEVLILGKLLWPAAG